MAKVLNLPTNMTGLQTEMVSDMSSGSYPDKDNYIQFKPNNTYVVRLLFAVSEDSDRNHPFIMHATHTYRNEVTNEWAQVTCPVSDHILGRKGFKVCPVCTAASKAYNEFKEQGIASSEEIYKLAKRSESSYIYAYVVQDTNKPENEGTIKVLRVGAGLYKQLILKIFGIDTKSKKVVDTSPMGADAFNLKSGFDLKIVTTPNEVGDKVYNSYAADFVRKPTDISGVCTQEMIDEAVRTYDIDGAFYVQHDIEELKDFVNRYIYNNGESADAGVDININIPLSGTTSAPPAPPKATKEVKKEAKAEAVAETKKEKKAEPEVEDDISATIDDLDLDDFL